MSRKQFVFQTIAATLFVVLVAACGPKPAPTAVVQAPTATPAPTDTITPTTEPTSTPTTTATARLTDTPIPPTATPGPPEPTSAAMPIADPAAREHLERGLASLAQGRTGLAVAHFDRALALEPEWTDGYLYRGVALGSTYEAEEAAADLDRVLAEQDDRAEAYFLRAWTHFVQMSDLAALDQIREDLARALELDPELYDAQALQAGTALVDAMSLAGSDPAQAQDQAIRAVADLAAAVAHDPQGMEGYYILSYSFSVQVLAEAGEWWEGQLAEAEAWLARDPGSPAALYQRGLAYILQAGQHPAEAAEYMQKAGMDWLAALEMSHARQAALGGQVIGPLQAARIQALQQASIATVIVFFSVFPPSEGLVSSYADAPGFLEMLQTYGELAPLMPEVVDDPHVFALAFRPDGAQIATISETGSSYLDVWDAGSGEKVYQVELALFPMVMGDAGGNYGVAYSPDGGQILAAYPNKSLPIVDASTGEVLVEILQVESIACAALHPDGSAVVIKQQDGIRILDAGSGEERQLLPATPEGVDTVSYSADGRWIVLGGDPVRIVDAGTGKDLLAVEGYEGRGIAAPALSPDGHLLATGGGRPRVWDTATGEVLYALEGHRGHVAGLAFSPDGRRLASASQDGTVRVWDAETGDLLLLAGHPAGVNAVAFGPDGRLLASGGDDGTLRIWDMDTGEEVLSVVVVSRWFE